MLTLLIVSQILSWIVILGLGLALLALARQVGVLHMRVAPAGAFMPGKGPAIGEAAPVMEATTLDGAALAVGKPAGRKQLLLFVSPQCPLCKDLIPVAKSFARTEKLDIVFIADDQEIEQRAMNPRMQMVGLPF